MVLGTKHLATKQMLPVNLTLCLANWVWAKVNVAVHMASCLYSTVQILDTSLDSAEVSVACLENELRTDRKQTKRHTMVFIELILQRTN